MTKQSYSYSKEWTNKIVDSSEFKKQDGHQNPNYMPYESERYISSSLKLKAFIYSKKHSTISKLSNGEKTADEMINDY